MHLITCHNDMAKNIVKAVERCGLKVDQLIFAGLAASYSVLTEDERELGVCVVDIGGVQWISRVYRRCVAPHESDPLCRERCNQRYCLRFWYAAERCRSD